MCFLYIDRFTPLITLCVGWSTYKGTERNNVGRKRPSRRVRNERDATKEAARGTRLLGRLWNGTGNERLAEPEGRVLDVPGICVLMQVRWLCSRPKESVSQSVSRSRRVALGCATRLRGRFCFFSYFFFPPPPFFFVLILCGGSTCVSRKRTEERGLLSNGDLSC